MMGKPEAPKQKGLIPCSLEQIFETSQSLQCQGWTYKIQASMIKIYNETIRDLLSPNRSTRSCLTLLNKQYTIKHDSTGNTHVPNLTIVDVCSIKEISFLLDQGARCRLQEGVELQGQRKHGPLWSFLLQRVRLEKTTATVPQNIFVHGVAAPAEGVKARRWEKEKGSLDFEDGSSLEAKEVAMRERDLAEEEVVRLRNVVRWQRKELRSRMVEVEREESELK
ncbi:hypothetical protein HPP92_028755 [Vanilla planifolia]|uniref:Kinesin motor domain-containing protein n=1 Tax=Vanilla planifolia TaxID=51239 RepID=A0A835U347_VANPL|nr:hypothetical protein HPP92_028755 [Vanilla planifolia]